MSDRVGVLRGLLALLAGVLLMTTATATVARADSYGEIGHPFGERGTGPGQFKSIPSTTVGFGVDPADNNSVYVVDSPNLEKNEYRIQKFSANAKGEYGFEASVTFKAPIDSNATTQDRVEGVAVDPTLERVYVLAVEERPPNEEKEEGEEVTHRVDGGVFAAGTLYAFSTKANGAKLEPASGTTNGGVLAGAGVLKSQSETPGEALLEPKGITVDPTTHEVIILGAEDPGEIEEVPQSLIALQRVTEKGKLGARYVDTTNFFEIEPGGAVPSAASPVVTSSGKVYVETVDQIVEIPSNFTEKTPPSVLLELEGAKDQLTGFPAQPPSTYGAGLSIGPEGTIYAYAGIQQQVHPNEAKYPGVLLFNSDGVEEGWTGGQSKASAHEGKCLISFSGTPAVAAGKEHDVFVYDSNPNEPRVLEFGPNGTGCPHASATAPSAEVEGRLAPESEPVPISKKVSLSSTLTQGNALSVEWEFGDGTKETVSTDEYEKTEAEHQFTAGGELTVTEKIHTDDLATPEIVVHSKINIVATPPTVVTDEAQQVEDTSATVTATVDPNGGTVSECYFEYGETESYGKKASCASLPNAGAVNPVNVSAQLSGLSEHTTYHFRIVAVDGGETSKGADAEFTTGPKPTATTEAASGVSSGGATLNGAINPQGATVKTCKFEYGTSTAYGQVAACASEPGSGDAPVAVSAAVTGLKASTTYHFRVVAVTAAGTSNGEDKTFATGAAQVIEEGPPHEIEVGNPNKQQEEAEAAKKHQEEEAAAKKKAEEEAAKKKAEEEKAKAKPTRAQLLAKALKSCKKESKKKRSKCEAAARKKYGSKTKGKKKKK
ncbi:MAG TPA: hypothetical protein VNV42_11600 [Solirubrobacteraceae bacterium]|nr:hypothetical protein [Solirubrobacteraceae bacterium]